MKKILTTLAASGIALGAFAQGYVNWNGSPAGAIISQTNSLNYSSLSVLFGGGAATGQQGAAQGNTAGLSGNVYYYALLYSTVDTTTPTTMADLNANWTASGLQMTDSSTGNNGRINPQNASVAAAIDPSYSGGNLSLMMVGWSANLGTTYSTVLNELNTWPASSLLITGPAYFGAGFVGQTPLSTSSVAGTTIWSTTQTPGGLISNPSTSPMVLSELEVVPEPGTLALAAISGASLLLFRRKK